LKLLYGSNFIAPLWKAATCAPADSIRRIPWRSRDTAESDRPHQRSPRGQGGADSGILWLLGVPFIVVVLLMRFHVI
jgi:hypothetical protein